ncbi:MAG: hypothetical protein ACYDCQ_12905 [Dehalococcoidia bacterium]
MTALPVGILVGTDLAGGLFCLRADGQGGCTLTTIADPEDEPPSASGRAPAAYVWPTWLPGQPAVLASTIEVPIADGPPAQLLRLATGGGDAIVLHRSPQGSAMVGPNAPYYVNPSLDGKHVAVLTQAAPGGLALLFADALGRGPAQPIHRGAPLFSAWAPASDALLLHVGGELSLMEIASAPSMQVLAGNHVNYRVPAWSPDGSTIAVAVPDGGEVAVELIGRDGGLRQSLVTARGLAAFAWSPDGEMLAVASGRASDPPLFADLGLVPAAGGPRRPAQIGDCLAFCWSPNGSRLAALCPDAREGRLAWTVLDREGRRVRRFSGFRPSAEFGVYVAFFDQYALSHRLWSPDGSAILGCGRIVNNGTPPELLPSRLFSFDVDSGDTVDVAAGGIAFWSAAAG